MLEAATAHRDLATATFSLDAVGAGDGEIVLCTSGSYFVVIGFVKYSRDALNAHVLAILAA